MPLQTLDELIRVHDNIGEIFHEVTVALHLLIEVTGDIREIDQGLIKVRRQHRHVCVGVADGPVYIGESDMGR